MRNRRSALDHSEAVARRLALLNAELGVQPPEGEDAVTWAGPTRISGTPWPEDPFDDETDAWPTDEGAATAGRASQGLASATVADEPGVSRGVTGGRGRHAARQGFGRRGGIGRLLDGSGVAQRAPGQVAVVLAGLVLALAVTCGWLLLGGSNEGLVDVEPLAASRRDEIDASVDPSADERASAGRDAASISKSIGPSSTRTSAGTEVVVHVAGKVKRPGIVVLPAGARVADALERAGGARRGVDTSSLNLARVLVDGEQVLVGEKAPPALPGLSGGTDPVAGMGAAPPGAALVNVNTAPQSELESLPGVGPVMATAIIEWRTTHGGFATVGDLLEVKGIGEATLSRLTPLVTL